jgi:hypothetical protein
MGEDLYESLHKALQKLTTSSVVDIGELYHSLKVAPKAVVAFLVRELKDMKDAKEVKLPWAENASMLVNKLDSDVYQGHIVEDGHIKHEFRLSSLPALAAHLTSHFELYDEDQEEEAKPDQLDDGKVKALESKLNQLQIQALEAKINSLMALVSAKVTQPVVKVDDLSKAGLMPKMPSPPKPGIKVGGNQGIMTGGVKGDKTAATDRMSKPVKSLIGKPMLNTPPVKSKLLTFNKSDMMKNCMECRKNEFDKSGNYTGCDCWKGMSKPKVKKSDSDTVTIELPQDWDSDAVVALIRSVKKYGRESN